MICRSIVSNDEACTCTAVAEHMGISEVVRVGEGWCCPKNSLNFGNHPGVGRWVFFCWGVGMGKEIYRISSWKFASGRFFFLREGGKMSFGQVILQEKESWKGCFLRWCCSHAQGSLLYLLLFAFFRSVSHAFAVYFYTYIYIYIYVYMYV